MVADDGAHLHLSAAQRALWTAASGRAASEWLWTLNRPHTPCSLQLSAAVPKSTAAMGIGGALRASALLLLIRTWLAESNDPSSTPQFYFELSSSMPEVILDLINCKNCANESVVQKILDRVLSTSDVQLRPNFGGAPVAVLAPTCVSSIEQISEINMDYTITTFLHQTWKDKCLAYYETNLNLTLEYEMQKKLWVPDCYFVNSKDAFVHAVTVENRVFKFHPGGTVRYGIGLTTTAACSWDLKKIPMDKQGCKLEVESYGYTVEDIVLSWEDDNAINITDELHIPQCTYQRRTITSREVDLYTGLTSILVLTAIDSHMWNKRPHISCIKAIDIYILVCLFFVFLTLVEYVYINYLFFIEGPQCNRRRCRKVRRVVARYLYQEVVVGNVQGLPE